MKYHSTLFFIFAYLKQRKKNIKCKIKSYIIIKINKKTEKKYRYGMYLRVCVLILLFYTNINKSFNINYFDQKL